MYLRRLTGLVLTVLAPGAVLAVGATPATADVPTIIYVRNFPTSCSDSGPGTQTQPLCTIAAGVAAVQPGEILDLIGVFDEHVTIDKSGTPTAPITIEGGTVSGPDNGLTIDGQHDITVQIFRAYNVANGPAVTITNASSIHLSSVSAGMAAGATAPAVALTGVTNSSLTYPQIKGSGTGKGIALDAATSGVTVDHGSVYAGSPGTTAIDIAGSGNTVTGSMVTGGSVAGIALEPGAANNTIVNAHVSAGAGGGIVNTGATGTAITNNEVKGNCGTGIRIAGDSSGVSVQNNLVNGNGVARAGCTPPSGAVNIGGSDGAVGHTVVDYNNVHEDSGPADAPADYAWPTPMTPAQFQAASGQGAHDVDSATPAAAVDSANSAAPGYPTLDFGGRARVDDGNIPNTGSGPIGYADRGPNELGTGPVPVLQVSAPPGLTVSASANLSTDGYATLISWSYDFGDGTPATVVSYSGFVTHTYAKPGRYLVTLTLSDSNGLAVSASSAVWATVPGRQLMMLAVANDRYVVGQGSAPLVANAIGPDGYDYFELDDVGNGYVALRTAYDWSTYAAVDPGRGGQLTMSQVPLSDTGLFQLVTNPDGSFSLKAKVNDMYVTAEAAGTQPLTANRTAIGTWERFRYANLSQIDRSLLAHADTSYVTAEAAGTQSLIANRAATGPWERFDIVDAGGGYVALYSRADSRFVTAEAAGTQPLIANRTDIGTWEQFTLVTNGDGSISLIARANGRYVTAEAAGTQPLIANRTAIGRWEEFDLR